MFRVTTCLAAFLALCMSTVAFVNTSICAEPNQATPVTPEPDSTVSSARPTIVFSTGPDVQDNSVHIFIDNIEVYPDLIDDDEWEYSLTWDLPEGENWVSVTFIDSLGQPGGRRWSFFVDTSTPSIAISSPDRTYVGGNTVEILGTFDGLVNRRICAIELSVDGVIVGSEYFWNSQSGGEYWGSVNGLSSGPHTILATVFSPRGISAEASYEIVVLPPLDPNQLTIENQQGEISLLNSASFTASVSNELSDWLVTSIYLTQNGVDPACLLPFDFSLGLVGDGSTTITATPQITWGDYDGYFTAHFWGWDSNLECYREIQKQIFLDLTPPVFIDTTASPLINSDATLSIVDPECLDGSEGAGVALDSIHVFDMDNNWIEVAFDLTDAGIQLINVANGVHHYFVVAADKASNQNYYYWSIAVEHPAPDILDVGGDLNYAISAEATLFGTFHSSASISVNFSSLSVVLTDGAANQYACNTDQTESGFIAYPDPSDPIPAGWYAATAVVSDACGTISTPVTWMVEVAYPKPTFENLSPSSSDFVPVGGAVMSGQYSAGWSAPIDPSSFSASATMNGQDNYSFTVIFDGAGFSLQLDPLNMPPEGRMLLTLTVADTLGEVSDALEWEVFLDFTAPQISMQIPANAEIAVETPSATFTVTDLTGSIDSVTEGSGVAGVLVSDGDGNPLEHTLIDKQLTVLNLIEGINSIVIIAYDRVGNWSVQSFDVTYQPETP